MLACYCSIVTHVFVAGLNRTYIILRQSCVGLKIFTIKIKKNFFYLLNCKIFYSTNFRLSYCRFTRSNFLQLAWTQRHKLIIHHWNQNHDVWSYDKQLICVTSQKPNITMRRSRTFTHSPRHRRVQVRWRMTQHSFTSQLSCRMSFYKVTCWSSRRNYL